MTRRDLLEHIDWHGLWNNDMQGWINSLDPRLAFLLMSGLLLIAGIAGWYVAEAVSSLFERS